MDKLDYKKANKDLYMPTTTPSKIFAPKMTFIMVDGKGDPNMPDGEYTAAVELLYTLTYAIKMSNKGAHVPAGYFEYVVPPLEGFWEFGDDTHDIKKKDLYLWTSLIRQPEFVSQDIFLWAASRALITFYRKRLRSQP